MYCFFFFFKQKTAYDMRISDWSSDVCSSDLYRGSGADLPTGEGIVGRGRRYRPSPPARPALTCPVAGLDFPPVLNSTEPAEIMYGKAAPALRYGSSSLSQIGRAHVCTPVTNAHLVCRLLLDKKKTCIDSTHDITINLI